MAIDAEGDLVWRKSSFSGLNGCVEVARSPHGEILVRDSKNLSAGQLSYTPHEWRSFLAGLAGGEFDFLLPGERAQSPGGRAAAGESFRQSSS